MEFGESAPVKVGETKFGRGVIAKHQIHAGDTVFEDASPVLCHTTKDKVDASCEIAILLLDELRTLAEPSKSKLAGVLKLFPSTTGDLFKEKPMQYMKGDEATRFVRMIDSLSAHVVEDATLIRMCGCKDLDTSFLFLLAVIRWNIVEVKDLQESRDIGWALSCGLSMVNHSCEPNVCHAFDGDGHLFVRAITEIEEGDQLFMTYVKLYEYKKYRLQVLKSNFDFECRCGRCQGLESSPSALDKRPPCLVKGLSKREATDRENQLIMLAEQVMFQYATALGSGDTSFSEAISSAKKFMKASKGFYSALHPRFLTTIELLGRIYCELQEYQKAATHYQRVLTMMDMVYPKHWYPKSVPLAVLSGLYRVLGDTEKAKEMFARRRELLRITRGAEEWDDGSIEILPLLRKDQSMDT